MKYIRTKDGRVLRVPFTKQEYDTSFPNTVVSYEEWFELWKYDIQILNQADNIEELCDAFVYETNKNNHYIKDKHNTIQLFFDNEKPVAYYGAIWTDKGLIYVAKMNNKGELELL